MKLLSDVKRQVSAQYGSLNPQSQMVHRNTFLTQSDRKDRKGVDQGIACTAQQ